ncbi:ribosome maturation factor RimM [Geomicrobium sp. JSM 1781026]|uniref:ribosome maturation factor RimM n=1 Tax=unclassified Geomicrobium TaxID=2628951 RepID=UPI0005A9A5C1|nr:ribosome maturation factor RimM [Geomicrobium sp. JCM 19037]
MTSNTEYFKVGTIVNTHGVRGEVRVIPSTDFKEERFQVGNTLSLLGKNKNRSSVKITGSRTHKQFQLLTLEGIDSKESADTLRDAELQVHESEREHLPEGDFYYSEIVGLNVVTTDGQTLGVVKEILSPGANDVWVVKRHEPMKKDVLLPYIDDVIIDVNRSERVVTVRLMEGLLDE